MAPSKPKIRRKYDDNEALQSTKAMDNKVETPSLTIQKSKKVSTFGKSRFFSYKNPKKVRQYLW